MEDKPQHSKLPWKIEELIKRRDAIVLVGEMIPLDSSGVVNSLVDQLIEIENRIKEVENNGEG